MFDNSRIVPIVGLAVMVLLGTIYLMPIMLSMALAFFPLIFIVNTSGFGNALPGLLLFSGLFCLLLGTREKGKSKT